MFPYCFEPSGMPEIFAKRLADLAERRRELLAQIREFTKE